MTRLPRMLVGDAEPEATELVLNPTQAPIAIIPAPGAEPSRMAPGFQTGTLVPGKREIRSQSQDVRRLPGPEPTTSPSFDQGFNDLLNVLPTAQTTQDELMRLEQLARPPAVDALVTGQTIPDLDVTAGSNFRLFTPQQFAELTPDEVAALSTTLASQNKSLDDFLFSLGRRFESRRERSRGRLNPLR